MYFLPLNISRHKSKSPKYYKNKNEKLQGKTWTLFSLFFLFVYLFFFFCYAQVCQYGKVKQGVHFCEGCRSFFNRNRNRHDLVCKSGTNNCLVELEDDRHKMGSKHKYICPACRLARCLETRRFQRQKLANIGDDELRHCEQLVGLVMKGKHEIVENMNSYKIRNNDIEWTSPIQIYNDFMDSFCHQFATLKKYGNIFPAFPKLNLQDKIAFFMATRFRIIAGENVIRDDGFSISTFSNKNHSRAFNLVRDESMRKVMDNITKQSFHSWTLLKGLQFSDVEKAFLLAFLFFDGILFIYLVNFFF